MGEQAGNYGTGELDKWKRMIKMNKLTLRKTMHFQVYAGDEPLAMETALELSLGMDDELDNEVRDFLISANGDQEAMAAYYEIKRRPRISTKCIEIANWVAQEFKDRDISTIATGAVVTGEYHDGQRYVIRIEPVEAGG